jgi:hypothetical protein
VTHVSIFTLLGLLGWHAGEVYKARSAEPQTLTAPKGQGKRHLTDRPKAKSLIPPALLA